MARTQAQIDADIAALEVKLGALRTEKNKVAPATSILSSLLNGTVIQWDVKFNDWASKTYRYVAIKQGGTWYTTSKKSYETTYTTEALAAKLVELKVKDVTILRASAYDQIQL